MCETDGTNQWTSLKILARFGPRLLTERDGVRQLPACLHQSDNWRGRRFYYFFFFFFFLFLSGNVDSTGCITALHRSKFELNSYIMSCIMQELKNNLRDQFMFITVSKQRSNRKHFNSKFCQFIKKCHFSCIMLPTFQENMPYCIQYVFPQYTKSSLTHSEVGGWKILIYYVYRLKKINVFSKCIFINILMH